MTEPHGVMFGIGWHLSQELGRSLVNYAPRNKDDESLDIYLQLNAKLPRVSALYRHGLACLFPGGGIEMQGVADREGVASFADALDGVAPERPFANSLTATRSGFCNYQHCDKDFSIAYGMWWEVNNTSGKWTFTSNADHNKTSGGEFMWGAYGIGVDFARARGLIEIFWRGQLDFHGTLNSTDVEGYTRFGTSIQITRKGVNAMQKVWNVDELAQCGHNVHELNPKFRKRITTAQDRVDKARKDMVSIFSKFI
ncbi:hypothetical protein C8R44DRAFT_647374 [Mycena epipterygia]|nr:hypothetical protein C8R44DRAFT_647374 [Mycena epipterygia]